MAKNVKPKEKTTKKKTKGSVGKAADRAKIVSVKAKDGVIEAKSKIDESTDKSDNRSPEQYATDEVTKCMHKTSEDVVIVADKAVKSGVRKVKEKVKQKKFDKKTQTANNNENPVTVDLADKQKQPVDEKIKPKQRKQTLPKTRGELSVKKPKADQQPVKYAHSSERKIKQTARSSANTKNTIKIADNTIKNAKKSEKAAKKSTEATAKAAKRAEETAKKIYWRCLNRIEHGSKYCKKSVGIEEYKLHEAICKALSSALPNKDEILKAVKATLEYAVSSDNDALNRYNVELNIKQLQDEADMLMDRAAITEGDQERYFAEIEKLYDKIKALRQQLETLQTDINVQNSTDIEVKRISEILKNEDFSFTEFDDTVIRRIVDCIRVMGDKTITVILKGGFEVTETI